MLGGALLRRNQRAPFAVHLGQLFLVIDALIEGGQRLLIHSATFGGFSNESASSWLCPAPCASAPFELPRTVPFAEGLPDGFAAVDDGAAAVPAAAAAG